MAAVYVFAEFSDFRVAQVDPVDPVDPATGLTWDTRRCLMMPMEGADDGLLP